MNREANKYKSDLSNQTANNKLSEKLSYIDNSTQKNQQLKEKITDNILIPGQNKTLLNRVIAIINNAQDVLCIASFLIQEESVKHAIVEAASKGVRVYILTVAEIEALRDAKRDGEDPKSVKAHIEFVKSLYGTALVRTGQNFHAKYLLADPQSIQKRKGLLFTGNLTGSLIKSADIALILNPEQINGLYHQFLIGFWKMATGELIKDGYKDLPQSPIAPEEIPGYQANSSLDFNAGHYYSGIQKKLISFIQETDGPIIAFAWSFDYSNSVIHKLMKALVGGRSLEVIFNNIKWRDEKNSEVPPKFHYPIAMERLLEKKAKIFGYPRFHAKGLISSQNGRTRAIVMTANYDAHSIDHGFNSLIEVDVNQALKIKEVVNQWKNNAEYILAWNDNS